MEKQKHTPGPWVLVKNGTAMNLSRETEPHHTILLQMNHIPREEWEANTHLIAAAPELLMGCKCALIDLQGLLPKLEPSGGYSAEVLRTAIAKAEG